MEGFVLFLESFSYQGIMIYPVDYVNQKKYPLIVIVHGGPESGYSQSWLTYYAEPGQVLAGKGYAVFFPNYRASTGYGLEFARAGLLDPAGKEFDDIADGIEYLIKSGISDSEHIGLGGGSYGVYAAAWFASYYTKYVKAVEMFVGISDLISKRATTDVPYEELYVHSGKKLEDIWDLDLKRSPIYYAHQSKTAVLIVGGADDPRVPPSQSIRLYRVLKMNDHPAVRLVQYPGERYKTPQWSDAATGYQ
jgi:dipeptidyl aminopeptidase/acylaminoacyl peptidase